MTQGRSISADAIVALAKDAGACAAGVVACSAVPEAEAALLRSWLARGRHGDMAYLERNQELAADPASLLEGARTIVSCAFAYGPADVSDRHELFADYARGADYHKALRRRLRPVCRALEEWAPGSRTRICVDSAPVRERYWAVRAGLGHTGLNGQLIVPGVGSKVFLAEILWTGQPESFPNPAASSPASPAASPAASPEASSAALSAALSAASPEASPLASPGSCIGCGACLRACPGGALDGHGGVDARRCLSYLTIEYRGDKVVRIPPGQRIYGCDICQDVCPENHPLPAQPADPASPQQPADPASPQVAAPAAIPQPLPEFRLRTQLRAFDLERLSTLSDTDYDLLTIGSAIRRLPSSRLQLLAST